MNTFEFLFSLFGLLLGFGLADILGGFSRAFKARGLARIGWLTPLLGLVVVLDTISFWTTAWSLRDLFVPKFWVLILGFFYTGLYYMAATLVFPEGEPADTDHDQHYFSVRKWVAGILIGVNVPAYADDLLFVHAITADRFLCGLTILFFVALIGILVARGPRWNIVFLSLLIANYFAAAIDGAVTG